MISATAGTSASAVAASFLRTLRGVSSFTGRSARSRYCETCPTSVCACIGIHYPHPLFAWRCRLAASRVPFSARSFLVHGETSAAAARRWTAAGTPFLIRGRCSPSEVLPRLPITRASFCLSHSSLRFSVFRPYKPLSLSFRPSSSCLLGFSLTFSRYRPPARSRFYPPSALFLSYLSASISFILLPSCQLLTFLRAF